jgi:drug/metabolite transporter (DMT)-like permease
MSSENSDLAKQRRDEDILFLPQRQRLHRASRVNLPLVDSGLTVILSQNACRELPNLKRPPLESYTKGYLLAILAAFFSACSISVGKAVLLTAEPLRFTCFLFICACFFNLFTVLPSDKRKLIRSLNRHSWDLILLQAGLSFFAVWWLWWGVSYLDPTVAAFLSRFQTPATVLLGILLLGERLRSKEILGVILVFCGIFILRYKAGVEFSRGFLLVLGSALCFGVAEVVARKGVLEVEPSVFAFVRNSIVTLLLVLLNLGWGLPKLADFGRLWYLTPVAALTGPFLARLTFLYALTRVEVSKASILNQTQPLFVAILAFTFLQTIPTLREWIGGIFILGGCIMMIIHRPQWASRIRIQ